MRRIIHQLNKYIIWIDETNLSLFCCRTRETCSSGYPWRDSIDVSYVHQMIRMTGIQYIFTMATWYTAVSITKRYGHFRGSSLWKCSHNLRFKESMVYIMVSQSSYSLTIFTSIEFIWNKFKAMIIQLTALYPQQCCEERLA